jgi:hypothetical protein
MATTAPPQRWSVSREERMTLAKSGLSKGYLDLVDHEWALVRLKSGKVDAA